MDSVIKTLKKLKETFNYNPANGLFYYKNTNEEAGSKNKLGYIILCIKGKRYLAHRVAWSFIHGYMPENEIDHKNRKRGDNRIKNLREVSHSCNLRNSKNFKNNTSGVRGVYWFKRTKQWTAGICVNGKSYTVGYYNDFDEAVCARLASEQCLNWPGCNKNTPAFMYVKNNIQRNTDR